MAIPPSPPPFPPDHQPLPQGEAAVLAAADAVGLPIDPLCLPGVVTNMALLNRHAMTMLTAPADVRP